jgi:hypothetical protein
VPAKRKPSIAEQFKADYEAAQVRFNTTYEGKTQTANPFVILLKAMEATSKFPKTNQAGKMIYTFEDGSEFHSGSLKKPVSATPAKREVKARTNK